MRIFTSCRRYLYDDYGQDSQPTGVQLVLLFMYSHVRIKITKDVFAIKGSQE